ncbi:MAG TPA: Mth938-like domain-containing protein [Xanthobacteraceae bacterium]|nr:Mth938-like domain-containing protein [Xanthobacteraceae bacterium]
MSEPDERHFPGRAPIDAYGAGGFRFADMSHRGSILALPSGIWAWPPKSPCEISEASLARVFAEKAEIDILLIGCGRDPMLLRAALREHLREVGISFDVMPTRAAASTYNVLLGEGRRVAAALIAVE